MPRDSSGPQKSCPGLAGVEAAGGADGLAHASLEHLTTDDPPDLLGSGRPLGELQEAEHLEALAGLVRHDLEARLW